VPPRAPIVRIHQTKLRKDFSLLVYF